MPKEPDKLPEAFERMEGIHAAEGLRHTGSVEAYRSVLNIFYNAVDGNVSELETRYREKNWKDYVILVHAIKSTARTIGAEDFGELAQKLETAGKREELDYIYQHQEAFLAELRGLKNVLEPVCKKDEKPEEGGNGQPIAEPAFVQRIFEQIADAAKQMYIDELEDALEAFSGCRLLPKDQILVDEIREKCDNIDYEGILDVLERAGNGETNDVILGCDRR